MITLCLTGRNLAASGTAELLFDGKTDDFLGEFANKPVNQRLEGLDGCLRLVVIKHNTTWTLAFPASVEMYTVRIVIRGKIVVNMEL